MADFVEQLARSMATQSSRKGFFGYLSRAAVGAGLAGVGLATTFTPAMASGPAPNCPCGTYQCTDSLPCGPCLCSPNKCFACGGEFIPSGCEKIVQTTCQDLCSACHDDYTTCTVYGGCP